MGCHFLRSYIHVVLFGSCCSCLMVCPLTPFNIHITDRTELPLGMAARECLKKVLSGEMPKGEG